jgi:sugar-specific transcriptional regulator TrmB
MTTNKIDFQKLGLPKNSAIVLETLLNTEESKANELIKKLGIHRHLVYEALNDLERRGLIKRLVRNEVFYFRLLTGEPLVQEAAKKYEVAIEIARQIRNQKKRPESTVTFFEGVEGVNSFTEFVLKQNQNLFVLGANTRFRLFFPEIFDLWNEKRQQKKIHFKVLVPKDIPAEYLDDVEGLQHRRYDGRLFPGVIWVFGECLAHIVWNTKQNTEIIMLHQPIIAEQHRDLFETIWKLSKK